MSAAPGTAGLVLHTHLPWVLHHGRWPHGVDWLSEAVAECYLPLLRVLEPRAREGRSLGVTLAISPVLCDALAHPDFAAEFDLYAANKLAAARLDRARFARHGGALEAAQAERWASFYARARAEIAEGGGVLRRLRRLAERGAIEIATCAATHAYLPLLGTAAAVERQIAVAVERHRRHFGREPRGLWLPECAYRPAGRWQSALARDDFESWRPGLEQVLEAHGITHTFVDRHLIEGGRPSAISSRTGRAPRGPRRTVLRGADAARGVSWSATARFADRPWRIGGSAVLAFGRDGATSEQVWSRDVGYPADPDYLEFHRMHDPGGLRYWAVTDPHGDLEDKVPYAAEAAAYRVVAHAAHFLAGLGASLRAAARRAPAPHLAAMYDTELFGHWWFEGPDFLAVVLDRARESGVRLATAGEAAAAATGAAAIDLPEGSWGEGGDHRVWMNGATAPLWTRVHELERAFEAVARRAFSRAEPVLERVLRQAAREVMLLEASDWPFLVTNGTARDYAEARLVRHAADAARLLKAAAHLLGAPPARAAARGGDAALPAVERDFLAACEGRDAVFPDLDWRAGLTGADRAARRAAPAPAGV